MSGLFRLSLARIIIYLTIGLPVFASLSWLVLYAFGIHPGRSLYMPGFEHFIELFNQPAIFRSIGFSVITAVAATLLAMLIVGGIVSLGTPHLLTRQYRPWLALILSTPYLAFILGWQFVVSPSGLISRFIALITSADIPPNIATAPDPYFIGYIVMLGIKESGFLLMLVLVQLQLFPVSHYYRSGLSLGYTTPAIWLKILIPVLYPRLRLGIWILLIYAATNVEVALFAAPNIPELISVRIVQWFSHPDLNFQFVAAAAVVILIVCIILMLVIWRLAEILLARFLRAYLLNTKRGKMQNSSRIFARFHFIVLAIYLFPLVLLGIWSCVFIWQFPNLIPQSFSFKWWLRHDVHEIMLQTLKLAFWSSLLSLVLAVLYAEFVRKPISPRHQWVLYIPLITPHLALSGGLAVNANILDINGTFMVVLFSHLLLILPYMVLILSPLWSVYDTRYSRVGASLGYNPWQVWWKVKLPILIRPTLFAFALGVSVSVNLYIPTLLLGEGQISTLMTEMIGLGATYDRRLMSVFAVWLLLLPLLSFAFSSFYPHWRYGQIRNQH